MSRCWFILVCLSVAVMGQEVVTVKLAGSAIEQAVFHAKGTQVALETMRLAVETDCNSECDWVLASLEDARSGLLEGRTLVLGATRSQWLLLGRLDPEMDLEQSIKLGQVDGPELTHFERFEMAEDRLEFDLDQGDRIGVEVISFTRYRDLLRAIKRSDINLWVLPAYVSAQLGSENVETYGTIERSLGWFAKDNIDPRIKAGFVSAFILGSDWAASEPQFQKSLIKSIRNDLGKQIDASAVMTYLIDNAFFAPLGAPPQIASDDSARLDAAYYYRMLREIPQSDVAIRMERTGP